MLLAAAAKAATETHWWDDWLKFTPGWLAFLWVIGNAAWKGLWVRRLHLAVGPDGDDLRDAILQLRVGFEAVIEGRVREWDLNKRHFKDVARHVREHAERRNDRTLKGHLISAAESMDQVVDGDPAELRAWVEWVDEPSTPEEEAEAARFEAQQRSQKEAARRGTDHVTKALTRLADLERRTVGRS
ncbi:hypothetical protein [Streptomyces antibioticus]|uniref:hypothetical protein n=1 Tax=Streptomyces antibioticus TaxID=1890 RepID=UPI0033AD5B36